MPAPSLVVCEKSGVWAVALRAALADDASTVIETRSFTDCEAALQTTGMAAIEALPDDRDDLLQLIVRLASHGVPVAVLTSASFRAWEPLLREAGALHVIYNRRQARSIARIFGRYQQQIESTPLSLEEQIKERMPWKSAE